MNNPEDNLADASAGIEGSSTTLPEESASVAPVDNTTTECVVPETRATEGDELGQTIDSTKVNEAPTPEAIEPVEIPEEKHFEEWIQLKEKLHSKGKAPRIRQGEVWWCSLGENVGVEINGKSARFTRPVLIMKKLSRYGFMGIPLTSQPKTGSWYASFDFLGKTEYAAVCQARVMSVSRLHSKMGELPMMDLAIVKEAFHRLYK